jgi:hypothetical protein
MNESRWLYCRILALPCVNVVCWSIPTMWVDNNNTLLPTQPRRHIHFVSAPPCALCGHYRPEVMLMWHVRVYDKENRSCLFWNVEFYIDITEQISSGSDASRSIYMCDTVLWIGVDISTGWAVSFRFLTEHGFFSSPQLPDLIWVSHSILQWILGVKRLRREADHIFI